MTTQSTSTNTTGIGVFGLLGVLFVALKLTGFIDWSWWWVTAPFWAGFAFIAIVFLCVILFAAFTKEPTP